METAGRAAVVLAVLAVSALLGSCVYDYSTSTPQLAEVTVIDKAFYPEHYVPDCHTTNGPIQLLG